MKEGLGKVSYDIVFVIVVLAIVFIFLGIREFLTMKDSKDFKNSKNGNKIDGIGGREDGTISDFSKNQKDELEMEEEEDLNKVGLGKLNLNKEDVEKLLKMNDKAQKKHFRRLILGRFCGFMYMCIGIYGIYVWGSGLENIYFIIYKRLLLCIGFSLFYSSWFLVYKIWQLFASSLSWVCTAWTVIFLIVGLFFFPRITGCDCIYYACVLFIISIILKKL